MVRAMLQDGIVGRASERGIVDVLAVDLRDFTDDAHRSVDDTPFGGGPGMLLKAEPLFRAVEHIAGERGRPDLVVVPSPQGRTLTQARVREISQLGHVTFLCGRYEGIDALPLFVGTMLITVIAMLVAGPIGLFAAIYMAEYASPRFRATAKPILEILAGVPTVVFGFFAALTVAPAIRDLGSSLGLNVASESALAAGLVMGVMIIPFVSSLSDDVINAVPQSLRDGSYAMGATRSETIKKVVLPAALSGIVSAMMLAVSRAVGETMIVVMAAGLAGNLTFNPLEAVTTITVQIKTLLVGDQEFDSVKTLSAFALGFVLFFFTLTLNMIALRIVERYREEYD
jgi:phosphate ABC transporter permease protein PstC